MGFLQHLRKYIESRPLPVVFLIMVLISGLVVFFLELRQISLKKEHARVVLLDVVADMERSLEYNLSVMHTLSLIIIKNNDGRIDDFKPLADNLLPMFPKVTALLIAPEGLVKESYPLLGNEALIGYNLRREYDFWDRQMVASVNRYAIQIVGPLQLKRNWRGYIGLVPVYVGSGEKEENFWGLVGVLLRHEDILPNIMLSTFNDLGYSYQLATTRNFYGDILVLDRSDLPLRGESVKQTIDLMGLPLILSVTPTGGWVDYTSMFNGILAAILVSGILSWFISLGIKIRKNEAYMARLATIDNLTNVFNRRAILAQLVKVYDRANQRQEVLAVGYLDVDKFKLINDDLGHAAGDEVLKLVAKNVQKNLQVYDLVGRLGGDEFLFVLVGRKSVDEAKVFAEKLIAKLDISLHIVERDVKVSLSLGLTIYPEDDSSPTMLVQHADMAMYEAKKEEGNSVFYYSDLDTEINNS